jgi:hypothetical protein
MREDRLLTALVNKLRRSAALTDSWSALWENAAALLSRLSSHELYRSSLQAAAPVLAQVGREIAMTIASDLSQVSSERLAVIAALSEEDQQRHEEEVQYLRQLRESLGL